MIMARQHLTKEQKAVITQMRADGHAVDEIAHAIGKWPSTMHDYINGNIFEIREKEGKLPDGTPKAGREAGGTREASVSDFEGKDEEPDYKHYDITVGDELFEGAETLEVGTETRDGENEAEGLEPWAVWMGKRMDALAAEIGKRLEQGLWIDTPLIMEWNRHVDEISQQKILRGIGK